MKQEQKNITKVKTFIKENKKKIIVTGSVIGTGVVGYLSYKYLDREVEIKHFKEQIKILMEAASEGLFDESIATTTRKLNHRLDRRSYLLKKIEEMPNDIELKLAFEKINTEISIFQERITKFNLCQKTFGIEE